jgi:carboxymethylenebutenolidase
MRQETVSDFTTQDIECPGGMPGYLALPKGSDKRPGIVILHERYGFVRHPRHVAERFARLGMVGLAINGFYKCNFQDGLADGTKRYFMTDPESVDYMTAGVQALTATGRVDPSKIAVLGMCQTGRHPFVMAAANKLLSAAICWYGGAMNKEFETGPYYPEPLENVIARVSCPVLGLFGELDGHIPVANVRRLRNLLEQHGKTFEIHIYGDAPHGFLNDTMPERFRRPQSEAAWAAQMTFLEQAFSGGFNGGRITQRFSANLRAGPD